MYMHFSPFFCVATALFFSVFTVYHHQWIKDHRYHKITIIQWRTAVMLQANQ